MSQSLMPEWLDITLLVFAVTAMLLVNLAGVFLVAFQMPGTWLMLLVTAIFAWVYWSPPPPIIGWWPLVIMLILAGLGELVEALAGAVGARGAGATWRGIALAVVFGIVGAILATFWLPIPVVGTLVGAAIGAGVGSIVGDKWAGKEWKPALRGARSAAIGRFAGSLGKLIIACVMWLVAAVALVWS